MSHYDIDIHCACGKYLYSVMGCDLSKADGAKCSECQRKAKAHLDNEKAVEMYPEMFWKMGEQE